MMANSYKWLFFAGLIGVCYSANETDEEIYDKMIARFLNLGNGNIYPDTIELAIEHCNKQESTISSEEIAISVRYFKTFDAKFAPMFSSMNRSDTYNTLRWYCNSKDLGQFGALLNAKASDAKKVRDNAIVTLESLDTSRSSIADVVCIIRLYATKVQAMFDDTLGRDSIRRVLGLYREVSTFAENTGKAKDSGKCEFIAAPAPDAVKYLSFLLPVYKTIDRFLKYSESDDEIYDKIVGRFLGLGNGKPYPETDESAQQLCNSPAANFISGDVGTCFRYFASFGSKAQPMFHALNTSDGYTKLRWFCNAKDQGKLGQALNAKSSEAKKVRDTAIATLESLDTNRSTIADVFCVVNLYATKTETLYDGTFARDSVGLVVSLYQDVSKSGENLTKMKASEKCAFIAGPADYSKYMSFLTVVFKTFGRFLKITSKYLI